MTLLGGQGRYFQKSSRDFETSDTTSKGLGETFEGDSADTCAGKFPFMSMGGRANVKRAQPVSEDPHRQAEIFMWKAHFY